MIFFLSLSESLLPLDDMFGQANMGMEIGRVWLCNLEWNWRPASQNLHASGWEWNVSTPNTKVVGMGVATTHILISKVNPPVALL